MGQGETTNTLDAKGRLAIPPGMRMELLGQDNRPPVMTRLLEAPALGLYTAERWAEVRNSVPILSSAVMPCVILAIGWIGWLEPRTAQLLAESAVLVRIGGIVFVIGRLNGKRPSKGWLTSAAVIMLVALSVVLTKVLLTH